jgi:hydroxymethylglutaryl-CoA lyase
MPTTASILISEVGPRDGLQSISRIMPTQFKLRWLDGLYAAGQHEIEVRSFVPAKLLPQMADAAAVVAHALTLPGLTVMALVPNLRGAEAALAAGVHKLTLPVSASAAHSLANVRKTREQMLAEVRNSAALRNEGAPHVKIEAGISTAFGCALRGLVAEDDVIRIAAEAIEAMGVQTGIDLDALIVARDALMTRLPGEPVYRMTPEAGLTKGRTDADGRPPPNEPFARAAARAAP